MNIFNNNLITLLIYTRLIIKLGIPPFHSWIIILCSYINWINLFFLLTIQKIIPFYLLSLINIKIYFFILSIILCSIIPPIIILNLINLKKLITYSSINQLGWLILLNFLKNYIWFFYLIIYTLIIIIISIIIHISKITKNFLIKNFHINIILLIFIINISSLPPYSFFIFKWYNIFIFIENINIIFLIIILILRSFIIIYLYLNILYLSIFLNLIKSKLITIKIFTPKLSYIILFFILMLTLSLIILLI